MADETLQSGGRLRRAAVPLGGRQTALHEIDDRFHVADSVMALKKMMHEVTQREMTPDSINAACNCVARINETIRTAIQAAKFLADG